MGQSKERGTNGGGKVDLLCQTHASIVLDDSNGFVHPTREIECTPIEQIRAQIVYRRDAVFDRLYVIINEPLMYEVGKYTYNTIHRNVGIEPHSRHKFF